MSINVLSTIQAGIDAQLNIGCQNLLATDSITTDILNASTIGVTGINADLITLVNTGSVPNAPVGSRTLYNTGTDLKAINSSGTTVTFATTASVTNAIMSDGTTSVTGHFPSYLDGTGKLVHDSGIATSNLFLADGSVNMTGNLNANQHQITNVTRFTGDTNKNINFGNVTAGGGSNFLVCLFGASSSATDFNQINIGQSNTTSAQYDIALGNGINASGFGSVNLGGGDGGITNPQNNSVALGNTITLGAGDNGICVGNQSGVGAVSNAIAIGVAAVNSTANSCLLGNTSIANIRPNNDLTCDLGTTSSRYNHLYAQSLNVLRGANKSSGSGAVLVGGTVTVANTSVATGDIVLLSCTALGGTPGTPSISAINNGVSFVITSSSGTDTSTYSWVIIKSA